MFKKVLIANRGEIAVRVIRACRELGIPTVAIYSTADAESLHVRLATDSYCIGPAPSSESYLDIGRIMSVASVSGADAIHPGYGFLSERADFAEICEKSGVKFIGPTSEAMKKMGDKATARKTMIENDVPVTPGTGIVKTAEEVMAFGNKVGYPIILKATAGGGGKGMRVCRSDEDVESNLNLCQQEAQNFFGNRGNKAQAAGPGVGGGRKRARHEAGTFFQDVSQDVRDLVGSLESGEGLFQIPIVGVRELHALVLTLDDQLRDGVVGAGRPGIDLVGAGEGPDDGGDLIDGVELAARHGENADGVLIDLHAGIGNDADGHDQGNHQDHEYDHQRRGNDRAIVDVGGEQSSEDHDQGHHQEHLRHIHHGERVQLVELLAILFFHFPDSFFIIFRVHHMNRRIRVGSTISPIPSRS